MITHRFALGPSGILLLLVLLLGFLLILRAFGVIKWPVRRKSDLPKSALGGTWTSRIAEAIVLLCAGGSICLFTATNPSTNGYLLRLGELRPEFARVNLMVALCAGSGVLLAMLVCLLWRTWAAMILLAVVLCGYGLVLNGPEHILESLVSHEGMRPTEWYTITHTGSGISADLWVNGVYLGKTPVETTLTEFLEKVPYWPKPPEDFNDDVYKEPDYSERGVYNREYKKWIEFKLSKRYKSRLEQRAEDKLRHELIRKDPNKWHEYQRHSRLRRKKYYAQVKLGDEWGYSIRGGSFTGGGGGPIYKLHSNLGVVFPDRNRRLARLLDRARLSDYRVDEEWFKAAETFYDDGWLAVRRAMDDEPQMLQVFDDWAKWRYDLDEVTDAKSAWKMFERICREADELGYYATNTVTGRAVELLAPKLDQEQLIKRTVGIISSYQNLGWKSWRMNDRLQFGMSYRQAGFSTGARRTTGAWIGGSGPKIPISAFAVAHAVWMLYESQSIVEGPNIIQERIIPAVICWNHKKMNMLRIAARFGGPEIERFLLRQNWRANPDDLPWRQRMRVPFGGEVNGWLYLLANLDSQTGRKFRQENNRRLMKMTDEFAKDSDHEVSDELNFLFLDLDLGKDSLAIRYLPRFKELTSSEHYSLRLQIEYLIKAEPVSTPQMYVQTLRNFRGDYRDCHDAFDRFGKMELELDKRKQIFDAMTEAIEADVSNLEGEDDPNELRRRVLQNLKDELLPWTKHNWAEDILSQLKEGRRDYKADEIAAWVEHEEQGHPLVKMLAGAGEARLRVLVMGAVREHPTPENRALLDKLLNDSDDAVRAAAERTAEELKAFGQMPLAKLVSKPDAMILSN